MCKFNPNLALESFSGENGLLPLVSGLLVDEIWELILNSSIAYDISGSQNVARTAVLALSGNFL